MVFNHRKGISPLVAGVLLIGFAISVASLTGPFMNEILQDSQEEVDEDAEIISDAAESNIEISRAVYDDSSQNVTGVLRNNGQGVLENFTVTVYGSDDVLQRDFDVVLEPSQVESFNFQVDGIGEVESIDISSDRLPVRTQETVQEVDDEDEDNTLSGTVSASPGIEDAEVELWRDGQSVDMTMTDDEGYYEFDIDGPVDDYRVMSSIEGVVEKQGEDFYAGAVRDAQLQDELDFTFENIKNEVEINQSNKSVSYDIEEENYDKKPVLNLHQLQGVHENLGNDYRMVRDIDGSETEEWVDGFRPIASQESFENHFDGSGFVVEDLRLGSAEMEELENGSAVFGNIGEDGLIQNIGVKGFETANADGSAAIAVNNQGNIEKSFVEDSNIGAITAAGGIVTYNEGKVSDVYSVSSEIHNSENNPSGGITHENNGDIKNVYITDLGINDEETETLEAQGMLPPGAAPPSPVTGFNAGQITGDYVADTVQVERDFSGFIDNLEMRGSESVCSMSQLSFEENWDAREDDYPELKPFSDQDIGGVECPFVVDEVSMDQDLYWPEDSVQVEVNVSNHGTADKEEQLVLNVAEESSEHDVQISSGEQKSLEFEPNGDVVPSLFWALVEVEEDKAADNSRYAEFAGGEGTEEDPYLIQNWNHLQAMNSVLEGHFKLENDLEGSTEGYAQQVADEDILERGLYKQQEGFEGGASKGELDLVYEPEEIISVRAPSGEPVEYEIVDDNTVEILEDGLFSVDLVYSTDVKVGWKPVGDRDDAVGFRLEDDFEGSFDGQGHEISELRVNRSPVEYVGLFGRAEGADINNVKLRDVEVTGDSDVGGLVGYTDSDIVNVSVREFNINSGWFSGGLVGGNRGELRNAYALDGEVDSTGDRVGGLVGTNRGNLSHSYVQHVDVEADSDVGGIAGQNLINDILEKSFVVETNVSGSNSGALIGDNSDDTNRLFWDQETIGQSSATGEGSGDTTSLNTGEMQGGIAEIDSGLEDALSIEEQERWGTVASEDEDFECDGYPVLETLDRENQLDLRSCS